MPRLSVAPVKAGSHLKPSAFIAQHAELITQHFKGPIADIACGSGRNLLPFIAGTQRIDCYDIQSNCLDPYITSVVGSRLAHHTTDILSDGFQLSQGKYGIILLVHFYAAAVLHKIVQALKPGGFILLETIDDRGGNHNQLPYTGEVFKIIAPSISVLSCQAKPSGFACNRQGVKLLGQRQFQS